MLSLMIENPIGTIFDGSMKKVDIYGYNFYNAKEGENVLSIRNECFFSRRSKKRNSYQPRHANRPSPAKKGRQSHRQWGRRAKSWVTRMQVPCKSAYVRIGFRMLARYLAGVCWIDFKGARKGL